MKGGRTDGGRRVSWRIEERAGGLGGPGGPGGAPVYVYDVYRGRRRVAWGLKDRGAAERWISRLGGAAPTAPADAAVRSIWRALADAGVSRAMLDAGSHPHVSLADRGDLDAERFRPELEAFAREAPPLACSLASVGAFPTDEGVVFLAPVATRELLGLPPIRRKMGRRNHRVSIGCRATRRGSAIAAVARYSEEVTPPPSAAP